MQDVDTKGIVADFLTELRRASASVLLLDYDGTLAPFQTERDHAYPYAGVIPVLDRIIRSGRTRVVIVSGRPVSEIQALITPLSNLEIWGAHGLEHVSADGTYQRATIDANVAIALKKAREWAATTALASLLETKPGGVAIHWRGMTQVEIEKIEALVHQGWASLAAQPEVKLLRFDGGVELRATHPDKGDAVAAVLKNLDAHASVAFLGDDLTDEDAFQALGGRGLSILVRSEYRKTRANAWLRPPHELMSFFEQWSKSLST